ncbi:MAG: hypothetical protein IPJ89_00325 [Candidatus Iainarchaeum archaeon]|uniref:Translation elongation factor EF1B beta/delta subunit guanine nucleotide exchange domain-containing protein n=1 Tax=Candidatus Iainarchaeum sp. TaxID=3101447 RepID=A0A7T9DJW6_9ARCH|nr:MAG: hypothetical protein IPJ89_00325 [Candidatus Diapherotrites archaeon]
MGKIIVIYKVNPKDMEDLETTKNALRTAKNGECRDVQEAPIGFGIVVLKVAYTIPEKVDGVLDALTKEIESMPSVDSVEVEGMTLL